VGGPDDVDPAARKTDRSDGARWHTIQGDSAMASRGQYVLRIAGRMKSGASNQQALKSLESDLKLIFKKPGVGIGKTGTFNSRWPEGFVLENYTVCQWQPSTESEPSEYYDLPYNPTHPEDIKDRDAAKGTGDAWPEQAMFNFRAEIHRSRPGSLYLNRQSMLPDVEWFYTYRKYQWHKDITAHLKKLNKDHAAVIIEPIWYRDWQWYCGNGGC
jgi:hypothetical protein